MEKDPPILPELSVLPRERLRLIQMLIPGYYMDPTTIIHINQTHIIHHLKEKDQPEDTLPILSELSRLQREAEDAIVFYPNWYAWGNYFSQNLSILVLEFDNENKILVLISIMLSPVLICYNFNINYQLYDKGCSYFVLFMKHNYVTMTNLRNLMTIVKHVSLLILKQVS